METLTFGTIIKKLSYKIDVKDHDQLILTIDRRKFLWRWRVYLKSLFLIQIRK